MLELCDLGKEYKLKNRIVHAVNHVDLKFSRGELVSILGLSGSGKTTLVSMIGGLEKPSSGHILVDEIDTRTFKKTDWANYRKNTIGFVFQDFNLIQHMTALENIKLSLSLSGMDEKIKEERALQLIKRVGLYDHKDKYPTQLSGGQQQRVAIARALSNNPPIILADEPTGALDPKNSRMVMETLKDLSEQGHLVIVVTHNKYVAKDYSSRIIKLEGGNVITDDLIRDYQVFQDEVPPLGKSTLENRAAMKLAFNNLKIRYKSSLIGMLSILLSIIFALTVSNIRTSLIEYRNDFSPVSNMAIHQDNIHYLTPPAYGQHEKVLNSFYRQAQKGTFDMEKANILRDTIYQPFAEDTLLEIQDKAYVDAIIQTRFWDVTIENEHFIMVGLLPEEYKAYQGDIGIKDYPSGQDAGIYISEFAAQKILGKYNTNFNALEKKEITLRINGYNGLQINRLNLDDSKRNIQVKISEVFDSKSKSKLMANYYSDYIFTSYEYAEHLAQTFGHDDFSLIEYENFTSADSSTLENIQKPIGGQPLIDVLSPLKKRTLIQEKLNLFQLDENVSAYPSNEFAMRHTVLTNRALSKMEQVDLATYGTLYDSRFDPLTSAKIQENMMTINDFIGQTQLGILGLILIPSSIVILILYVSIISRTKEIGILKSIGAQARDIVKIFVLESSMLALAAGIVAIPIAIPFNWLIESYVEREYMISYHLGFNPVHLNWLSWILSWLLIVTIFASLGLLPGSKASRLHPKELLRSI